MSRDRFRKDNGPPPGHWTRVYRTHPLAVYETESSIFDNPELTRQELDLVREAARRLGAAVASPILDLACGPGRHSLSLVAQGHEVVGFDHSLGLLRLALANFGAGLGGRAALVCADLHAPPFPAESFNSVLLLGKSFGYFSDHHNRELVRRVRTLLRPSGFFGLELPDREPYLASMRPIEREERPRAEGGTLVSEYRCRWRAESSRLEVWERHELGTTGELLWEGRWDARLYDSDEVAELVRAAGFRDVAVRKARLVEAQGAKGDVLIVGAVR